MAVAKNSGLPGTSSSGCWTYGTIFSSGCRVQAGRPARASEAPMNLRKSRRLNWPGFAAPAWNSSRIFSRNAWGLVNSARLRQARAGRIANCRSSIAEGASAGGGGNRKSSIIIVNSPVAHAAVRDLRGTNVVIGDQLFSERALVGGLIVEVEDLVARPDEFFRLTMAVEAPFHVKHM